MMIFNVQALKGVGSEIAKIGLINKTKNIKVYQTVICSVLIFITFDILSSYLKNLRVFNLPHGNVHFDVIFDVAYHRRCLGISYTGSL